MMELSFAAKQLSSSLDGTRTTFRFTDGLGHDVAISIDGEVCDDFVDHCRIYYEPNPPALCAADVDLVLMTPNAIHTSHSFSETSSNASFEDINMVDIYKGSTSSNIARMLEWEFVRLLHHPQTSTGMLR